MKTYLIMETTVKIKQQIILMRRPIPLTISMQIWICMKMAMEPMNKKTFWNREPRDRMDRNLRLKF